MNENHCTKSVANNTHSNTNFAASQHVALEDLDDDPNNGPLKFEYTPCFKT